MILFRYVFSEIAKTFLMAFAGISSVIFIALTLSHLHQVQGISVRFLLALFPNLIPEVLLITIPTSLLLAITFSVGRLAGDNELNAMRANGVHLGRVVVPGLLVGVLLTGACWYIVKVAIPDARHARRNLIGHALSGLTESMGSGLREVRIVDQFIRFKEFRDGTLVEADIFLVDPKGNRESIRAREARLVLDEEESRLVLDLRDAVVTFQSDAKGRDVQGDMMFDRLTREIDLSEHFEKKKNLYDMTDADLDDAVAGRVKQRYSKEILRTEWHRRKAIACTPLVFALVAAPVSMLLRRGGRIAGLAAVVIPTFVVYYPLVLLCTTLGEAGRLPPWAAGWGPDAALAAVGLVVFRSFVRL